MTIVSKQNIPFFLDKLETKGKVNMQINRLYKVKIKNRKNKFLVYVYNSFGKCALSCETLSREGVQYILEELNANEKKIYNYSFPYRFPRNSFEILNFYTLIVCICALFCIIASLIGIWEPRYKFILFDLFILSIQSRFCFIFLKISSENKAKVALLSMIYILLGVSFIYMNAFLNQEALGALLFSILTIVMLPVFFRLYKKNIIWDKDYL